MVLQARDFSYSHRDGMMGDIRLIKDNCHLFCESRFPNLPPLADKLVDEAQKLVDKCAPLSLLLCCSDLPGWREGAAGSRRSDGRGAGMLQSSESWSAG